MPVQYRNRSCPPGNRSCPPADAGGCTDAEPLCYAASTMPGVLLKAIILSAYARAVLELIVSGSMGCKSPCSVCLCLMFHVSAPHAHEWAPSFASSVKIMVLGWDSYVEDDSNL